VLAHAANLAPLGSAGCCHLVNLMTWSWSQSQSFMVTANSYNCFLIMLLTNLIKNIVTKKLQKQLKTTPCGSCHGDIII